MYSYNEIQVAKLFDSSKGQKLFCRKRDPNPKVSIRATNMVREESFIKLLSLSLWLSLLSEIWCDCEVIYDGGGRDRLDCQNVDQSTLDQSLKHYGANLPGNDYRYADLMTFKVTNSELVKTIEPSMYEIQTGKITRFEFIYFEKTGLEDVRNGLIYQTLSLKTLILENNELKSIPKGRGIFKKFRSMNLAGNRIDKVRSNAFENFTMLQTVNLARNSIYYVGSKAFLPLTKLKVIDMSHNKLTVLNDHAFSLSSVGVTLDLANNNIMFVSDTSFSSTLRKLDLSHNDLNRIPAEVFRRLLWHMLHYSDSVINLQANNVKVCDENWIIEKYSYLCRVLDGKDDDKDLIGQSSWTCTSAIDKCSNYCDHNLVYGTGPARRCVEYYNNIS